MEQNWTNYESGFESSSSESEFNDGYASDLMGDEEDRQRLEKMSEKERETVLYIRSEQRDEKRHKWEIMKKLKQSKKSAKENGDDAKTRSMKRKKDVEMSKTEDKRSNAMAQLKAQRENKQQQVKIQPMYKYESYAPDLNNNMNKRFIPQKITSSSEAFQSVYITTKEQLEALRVSRAKFEKIIDVPNFDEVVVGCFIRVNIGTINMKNPYRVAEVLEVVEKNNEYDFGNIRTKKAFRIRIGDVDDETVRLEFISNRPFEQIEFSDWLEMCLKNGIGLPTVDRIKQKQIELKNALNYFCNMNLCSKKRNLNNDYFNNDRPYVNFAMRKQALMIEKTVAIYEGDLDRVNRIATEIQELEERAHEIDKKRTSTIQNIAYLNQRNRRKNIETVELALREEMLANKANMIKGNFDPFIRRHTKPTIPFKGFSASGVKKTDCELIPDSALKFAMTPRVDLNMYELNDFEIDIDIDLSNKPQPLEIHGPKLPTYCHIPKPMPHGWEKWEEYKEFHGFV